MLSVLSLSETVVQTAIMNQVLLFFSIGLFTMGGCTNHYNDMVKWADEDVPIGISIDSVKSLQPEYLNIEWNRPDTTWSRHDTTAFTLLFDIK